MSDTQSTIAARAQGGDLKPGFWRDLVAKEDWWAIWIALAIIVVSYGLFASGSSIKWLAVAPTKWTTLGEAAADLGKKLPQYASLFVVWAVLFGVSLAIIGHRVSRFLVSFLVLFVVSTLIFELGAWANASKYNLEPPLVALVLGLLISNVVRLPDWLSAGFRVEFYIKVGIILLGATLPFTLLVWAGPVAVVQASIVSLVTFGVIFAAGRALGLDKRFAAVLGVGGAVCGVSASIAIAGAVRAKREHASVSITLVILWAIVMIFVLPFVARALGLPTGIAGAWIGTSEFADAAGIAAAQAYGDLAKHGDAAIAGSPEAALQAFTLMKVVGRDIWIGIWAFVLAIVATTRWEREPEADAVAQGGAASTAFRARVGAGEIWARFPKFVIGFVLASALVTWVASHYSLAEYRSVVTPGLVAPITALRTWAFIFCFFSIGLTTRFGTLAKTGVKPFLAFTIGVAVNIVLGYVLSVHVFGTYWTGLGQ
ncbi:YeiH family protein [Pararobbsia silviterrae]|uniref:Putative sulfate exporter family transporter n=1 Tax=Pararobbsia silviterrae TaxID=1792498 RepID=A0A494YEH1_9BURK|nr:putative sulfate exporter family transporter [Pararobbsia silviterrae]RKP58477.1 putative sulfate exporter family transporter [Pararobbsia silviterrae]